MSDVKYYKIMTDSEFIGIGTTLSLRRFQKKHQILLTCDESQAQYIQYKEKLLKEKNYIIHIGCCRLHLTSMLTKK